MMNRPFWATWNLLQDFGHEVSAEVGNIRKIVRSWKGQAGVVVLTQISNLIVASKKTSWNAYIPHQNMYSMPSVVLSPIHHSKTKSCEHDSSMKKHFNEHLLFDSMHPCSQFYTSWTCTSGSQPSYHPGSLFQPDFPVRGDQELGSSELSWESGKLSGDSVEMEQLEQLEQLKVDNWIQWRSLFISQKGGKGGQLRCPDTWHLVVPWSRATVWYGPGRLGVQESTPRARPPTRHNPGALYSRKGSWDYIFQT